VRRERPGGASLRTVCGLARGACASLLFARALQAACRCKPSCSLSCFR
jgi:hypothetical protein